jgi:hypothetical protein
MRVADRLEALLERQTEHPIRWFVTLALLLVIQVNPWWLPTPDATAYLSIARSLAAHHGLRMFGYSHIAYPPGYPILISAAFWISPLPFLALAAMQCLMALAFMLGLYRWMTRQTPTGAMVLTTLVMVNVTLWIYYHRTLSELAFMTTAIWAVGILDRALDGSAGRGHIFDVIGGAVLLILLTLIREAGMLFAVALGITALLRVRRGTLSLAAAVSAIAVILLPAAAAAIGFVIYSQRSFATTHMFGTHLSALFDSRVPLAQRLLDGIRLQICGLGRLIVPGMFKAYGHAWLDLNTLLYTIVFVPLCLGWWRWVRRRADPYAFVTPLYLILYAFWDFDADTRYVLPILPAVVVCLWYLVEPLAHRRLSIIAILAGMHLAVAVTYWTCVELPRARECAVQRTFIAQLVTAADNRPGRIVATQGVPECARLFFSLMLDRPVIPMHGSLSAHDKPDFLLATTAEQPAAGFHRASVAGAYVLLVEDKPAATQ